jgi:adenylosuccinate synthase
VARLIVLLSGQISSRKSTLCKNLAVRFDTKTLSTREIIAGTVKRGNLSRLELQELGERLDKRTNHTWVRDALAKMIQQYNDAEICVVDAVRTAKQIAAIRQAYGRQVVHIHLFAPADILARRFAKKPGQGLARYHEVIQNRTERAVDDLKFLADVVIDTSRCTDNDVVVRAASHLGLYGREYSRSVDVLVGGEYGSEGKGHVVSYLAKELIS